MSDVISRADAIEAVRFAEHRFTVADEQHGMGTVKWDMYGVYTAEAVEAIKALPSADTEWIKVTEDTPPDYPCLVCDANRNQPFVPMGIVTITDEEHGEWHIDGRLWDSPKVFVDGEWGNQISYGNRIIAWMPLPKPYREDGEA